MEGHANLLIYRNNTRELEHFEPHGNNFQGIDIDTMIVVNDVLDKDLDYLAAQVNQGKAADPGWLLSEKFPKTDQKDIPVEKTTPHPARGKPEGSRGMG